MADRQFWIESMIRIIDPVLINLKNRTLKKELPHIGDSANCNSLEAFARVLDGIAPWLELNVVSQREEQLIKQYRVLCREGLDAITDPESEDYVRFNMVKQGLVEAAHISQAIIRAPKQLWEELDDRIKGNLLREIKSTRKIKPDRSNWLLFSAIVEVFLFKVGEEYDPMRVDYALKAHEDWYLGDGTYGDGSEYHWDYYNSLVIQPMLIDIIHTLYDPEVIMANDKHLFNGVNYGEFSTFCWKKGEKAILSRAARYAEILEKMISPEGTYPAIGRSLAYRFGAFHLLAYMSKLEALSPAMSYGGVRHALTLVLKRTLSAPDMFDDGGWLRVGVYGYQPSIRESYIDVGSLYECCMVFVALGSGIDGKLWVQKKADFTSLKIWKGED